MLAAHLAHGAADATASVPEAREPPFIGDIALRYTPDAPADPLPLVMSAVERLVRRAAAPPAGQPSR